MSNISTKLKVLITVTIIWLLAAGAGVWFMHGKYNSKPVSTTPEVTNINLTAAEPVAIAPPQLINVIPEYTTVSIPKKVCQAEAQTQQVTNPNKSGALGTAVGGITGATGGFYAGQSVGGVWGGVIGAVVGAAGGGYAGDKIQKSTQPDTVAQTTSATVCGTVMVQKHVISGYDVTYSYNSKTGNIFMKHRPKHITVADIEADKD